MKTLILIRHTKSSWSNSDVSDKDRSLNDRGRDAALKLGTWLASNGHQPDQVLSSSANRCKETWDGIAKSLEPVKDVTFFDGLYLAEPQAMLAALQSASGDTVLMLGHMPGLGEFGRDLRRDPPPMHESFQKYPTGGTTLLEFRIENWSDAQSGTARFLEYVTPREL